MKNRDQGTGIRDRAGGEEGFMLLGLIVAIFLILLALSVAAPKMGRDLRRERDVEAVHRGNQYVRGIREYYVKFQHYPGAMDQLEKTNNIRFLRKKYTDPITGKDDWRTIGVGQNKTTVKGFFGQPLLGLAATGLGGGPGAGGAAVGANGAVGTTGLSASGAANGATGATGGFGNAGFPNTGFGSAGNASTMSSSGTGPFMGVGLNATGDSIMELNEQKTYETWEFLYDPRIEQLKLKAALNGAGLGTGGSAGSATQTPNALGGATGPTGAGAGAGQTPPAQPPMQPFQGAPVQQF